MVMKLYFEKENIGKTGSGKLASFSFFLFYFSVSIIIFKTCLLFCCFFSFFFLSLFVCLFVFFLGGGGGEIILYFRIWRLNPPKLQKSCEILSEYVVAGTAQQVLSGGGGEGGMLENFYLISLK